MPRAAIRRIGSGPSLPCASPPKSKSVSSLRKYGSTPFQSQPVGARARPLVVIGRRAAQRDHAHHRAAAAEHARLRKAGRRRSLARAPMRFKTAPEIGLVEVRRRINVWQCRRAPRPAACRGRLRAAAPNGRTLGQAGRRSRSRRRRRRRRWCQSWKSCALFYLADVACAAPNSLRRYAVDNVLPPCGEGWRRGERDGQHAPHPCLPPSSGEGDYSACNLQLANELAVGCDFGLYVRGKLGRRVAGRHKAPFRSRRLLISGALSAASAALRTAA